MFHLRSLPTASTTYGPVLPLRVVARMLRGPPTLLLPHAGMFWKRPADPFATVAVAVAVAMASDCIPLSVTCNARGRR
nr:hypothetical protein CFP56_12183 [Quercus suber]